MLPAELFAKLACVSQRDQITSECLTATFKKTGKLCSWWFQELKKGGKVLRTTKGIHGEEARGTRQAGKFNAMRFFMSASSISYMNYSCGNGAQNFLIVPLYRFRNYVLYAEGTW